MKKLLTLLTLIVSAWTVTQAERFECIADTWIREDSPTTTSGGTADKLEIRMNNNGKYFLGLFGFDFNIPEGKQVKEAYIYVVTERYKAKTHQIEVRGYNHDFEESKANWDTEGSFVTASLSSNPLYSFLPNGEYDKALTSNNTSDILTDKYKTDFENWVNKIPVTDYLKVMTKGTSRVNFMFTQGSTQQYCLFSKDNPSISNTSADFASTISRQDLIPHLEVEFEDIQEQEGTITMTLEPSADTWIYRNGDNKGGNYGDTDSMEIYTTYNSKTSENGETSIDDRELEGLIRFNNLPFELYLKDEYYLKNADLRLVTTFLKQNRQISLYEYNNLFAEDKATYATEENYVKAALSAQPILTFDVKGQLGVSLQHDNITEEYRGIDAWTNNIDLTQYLVERIDNASSVSDLGFGLLIFKPNNCNEATKFATKEAVDFTNAKDQTISIQKSDLIPQLTLEYAKKELVEDPFEIKKGDLTITSGTTVIGKHKLDNQFKISTSHNDFDYSQVKVEVAPRTEVKSVAALRSSSDVTSSAYHTATIDEDGINVTFLKPGEYTMTASPADNAQYKFEAISQDVDIETLKVTVGTPMTVEWAQDFAYGEEGYILNSLIEYPGSAVIEDLNVTLALTPSTTVDFNTATQPEEWSMSTGINKDMWNLMVEMQTIGKVDAYYSIPSDQEKTVDLIWEPSDSKVSGNVTAWFPCSGVYTLTLSSSDEGVEFVDNEGTSITSVDYTINPNAMLSYTSNGVTEQLSISGYIIGEDNNMVIANGDDENYEKPDLKNMVLYLPGCYLVDVDYGLTVYTSTEPDDTESISRLGAKRKVSGSGKNGLSLDLSELEGATSGTLTLTLTKNGAKAEPTSFNISLGAEPSVSTGIESIKEATDGDVEYFTLQGVKVKNPDHGIYIKIAGGKASKVIF